MQFYFAYHINIRNIGLKIIAQELIAYFHASIIQLFSPILLPHSIN